MTSRLHILLTDDHPLMLDAMKLVLASISPDSVIRSAGRVSEAVALATAEQFDFAILDLGLPDCTGIAGLTTFRAALPDVPVVVFSANADRATVLSCLDAGAMGFISKATPSEVVLNALRIVFAGSIYVPPEAMNDATPSGVTARTPADLDLTPRQREVMDMLLLGLSNKRICRALNIAENTVKVHMTAVLRALGAENRTQAVLNAARLGVQLPLSRQ